MKIFCLQRDLKCGYFVILVGSFVVFHSFSVTAQPSHYELTVKNVKIII